MEFTAVLLLQKNQVWLPALIWWFITTHNFLPQMLCSDLGHQAHTVHIHVCKQNILTHKINKLKGGKSNKYS